ncbi:Protein CBG06553 [Caenorhabditis briggsae]|uniref:Protein CBG06553 n=1 Tax=Caenorhabditis briggsae TaxID=6238 RepID=A8X2I3_CAEBR|nr:Protein CBG06553 [Caenorhabditis briggsae]CAP26843.1 Protein CBG06553 [Caenorhabditis briggsae]
MPFLTILVIFSTPQAVRLSQNATSWLLVFYSGIYSSTISNLAVQFVYRYWAIFDEKSFGFLKDRDFSSWLMIPMDPSDGEIIIMYCAIRMYFEMESKVQILSPALRNLHRQFFKTLVLQVVTPTVTLFAPVTVLIYLPLFDLQLDLPFGIFLSTLSIFPGTDAIIVMYVVQDYRLAMKNMVQKFTGSIITWANSPSALSINNLNIFQNIFCNIKV